VWGREGAAVAASRYQGDLLESEARWLDKPGRMGDFTMSRHLYTSWKDMPSVEVAEVFWRDHYLSITKYPNEAFLSMTTCFRNSRFWGCLPLVYSKQIPQRHHFNIVITSTAPPSFKGTITQWTT